MKAVILAGGFGTRISEETLSSETSTFRSFQTLAR